jgi:hypothetical protein
MPRFTLPTDNILFQSIANELVQSVIDTPVSLFKLNLSSNIADIYGDNDEKDYYNPVTLPCIIERSDTQYRQEGFGSDAEQTVEYRFNRDMLQATGVYPEIGDIIFHNDSFFEIDSVREDQLVGGQTYNKFSILCSTYMIRRTTISVNGVDFTPEPQVVDTHSHDFPEIQYDTNIISSTFTSDTINGMYAFGRDLVLFDVVSNELVNNVIKTDVLVYKVVVDDSVNIYGESTNRRYHSPIRLSCIIDRQDTQFNQEGFGSDASQLVEFMFNRSLLNHFGYYPEIGDVIYHNDAYFEMDSVREDQLVAGQTNQKFSVICSTYMVRIPTIDIISENEHGTDWLAEYGQSGLVRQPVGAIYLHGTSGTSGTSNGGSGVVGDIPFDSDLTVSLAGDKTFGRYVDGDVIPAHGKTASEVISMAVVEPIEPTVSILSTSTVFVNQSSSDILLNMSHVINSMNASISTATLEYKRGNIAWIVLSNSLDTSYTFIHTTPSIGLNITPLEYRYTVSDTVGATNSVIFSITPIYTTPSITTSITASSLMSPESNIKREIGNTTSNVSVSAMSSNPYVMLNSIILQYRIGNGGWVNLETYTGINSLSFTTGPTVYSILNNSLNTLSFRSILVDSYHTVTSSTGVISNTITIMFDYIIFAGNSASIPTDSNSIRQLPQRIFADTSNTFILNTGSVNTIFTIALPSNKTLQSVIDLDSLSANITSNYVYQATYQVQTHNGVDVSYKLYTMTIAIPYSESHRHQVTIL